MKLKPLIILLTIGTTFAGACSTQTSSTEGDSASTNASDTSLSDSTDLILGDSEKCLTNGGLERCWDIYVPQGINSSDQVPLLIDLHGFNNDPSKQRQTSKFDSLADKENFIVVWPEGIDKSWNAGEACCGEAVKQEVNDVEFLQKVIETTTLEYPVDQNRVYVSGLSNGCAMTQRLAMEASLQVSAVACMAHFLISPESSSYSPTPIMQLHGSADNVVAYTKAPENFRKWKEFNNCKGEPEETWRDGESFTQTYTDCDDSSQVAFTSIDGGGHGLYKDVNTEVDTTAIAWEFLSQFK